MRIVPRILSCLIAALFISACNFGTTVVVTATPSPTLAVMETASSTPQAFASATHTQTIVPTPTLRAQIPPTVPTSCVTRADWQVYYVVAGDTLSNLASRTGTTLAALVSANCIVNANNISVGQVLLVPRLPAAPTATSAPNPDPLTQGDIQISPYLASASRTFDLRAGDSVTLTWTNAPGGLANASFYIIETDGSRTLLGRDDYGADGWSTNWTVRLAINGLYVIAEGAGFNSAPFSTAISLPATLFSNWDANRVCVAQNTGPLPIHRMPGTDSEIVGELPANTQWLALAFATDNWLAVRGGGGWISASMQVNTSGNCNP